jgi:hypothetical protein
MISGIRRRVMVKDPAMAVEKWVVDCNSLGQFGNGIILCSNGKDVSLYMRIVENGGIFPTHSRLRTFSGAVSYHTGSRAKLDIMPIRTLQDAGQLGTESWPFMVFHNPTLWPDRTPIRLLLPHLSPAIGKRTTLITVGTDLALAPTPDDKQPEDRPKEIDWMAITRAISNG